MKNLSVLFFVSMFVINGKSQVVTIGSQVWMSSNLDVDRFRNGDVIPQINSNEEWIKAAENGQPAWCYYNNDILNQQKFGKPYNWYAVNDSRGLAPKGFHIPSSMEWTLLTDFLGGIDVAGHKMKFINGWDSNGNGTNESGFSATPGVCRTQSGFMFLGHSAFYWSTTKGTVYSSFLRHIVFAGKKFYHTMKKSYEVARSDV